MGSSLARERHSERLRVTGDRLAELEKEEAELWLKYLELDERTRALKDTGRYKLYVLAKKEALRADRKHVRCLDEVLRVERERLFAAARYSEKSDG